MPEPERAAEAEGDLGEAIDRLLGVIIRRRWWIGLPACAIALGTVPVLSLLPNRYTSEAVLVMQQHVLQRYLLPPGVTGNGSAVQAITRQVLSRANLVTIAGEFGLFAQDQIGQKSNPDTLAELMRRNLEIESLDPRTQGDVYTFKISFTAGDPQIAQAVTSRLTQLFIDENVRTRQNQAVTTSNFLKEQLDAARRKLAEQEQRLRAFKARFPTELPEQQGGNVMALTDLRIHLQSVKSNLSRAQEQRAALESSLSNNLERLQSDKAALLARYTERNAEVIRKVADIAFVERLLQGVRSGNSSSRRVPRPDDPALAELAAQVEANTREMADLSRQDAQLKSELSSYQSRLNLAPVREQELAAIVSDHELFRQQYADLLNKQQQSQLQTNLEESREGLQFRLIDPPSLPEKPSEPKRLKISLGGLALGVFLGLALAFVRDTWDRSFYCEKALAQSFPLPVVFGVPLLLTRPEERLRAWKLGFEWVAGCMVVVAILAAEFYVIRLGSPN